MPYCEPSARRLTMEPMMMSQTSSTVTCRPWNSSGNDGECGRGGLGDAEREVPRRAAHADDEIPARRGARVLGEIADQVTP